MSSLQSKIVYVLYLFILQDTQLMHQLHHELMMENLQQNFFPPHLFLIFL